MTSNQMKRPLGLQLLIYGFVLFWFILAAFPFIWTMWGSFKVELDFFSKADWTNVFSGVRTQEYTESLLRAQVMTALGSKKSFGALFLTQR